MVRTEAALSLVGDDVTLGEALAQMIKHRRQHLLVIDSEGIYKGELTTRTLARLLLPGETASQTREQAELETINDLDDRITPHLGRHVRDFCTRETPIMHPDTPLSEALQLLGAGGALRLPVVDPQTGKLVGVISALTVLRRYQF